MVAIIVMLLSWCLKILFIWFIVTCIKNFIDYRRNVKWYKQQNKPVDENVRYYKFMGIGKLFVILGTWTPIFYLLFDRYLEINVLGFDLIAMMPGLAVIMIIAGIVFMVYAMCRYHKGK